MTNNFPYNRLARYFAGECTERERAEIEIWIAADPTREDLIQSLRQIWNKLGQNRATFDADKLSREIFAKANLIPFQPQSSGQQRFSSKRPNLSDYQPRYSPWRQFVRIAAVVVMLVGGSYVAYRSTTPATPARVETVREFSSQNAERAQFKLSDGTRVWLNAAGTIRFSLEPGNSEKPGRREVTLKGEAYFEVARNEAVPFVVKTSKAIIEVLGTEFNVSAWQEDGDVQVAVAGGRVAVRANGDASNSRMPKEITIVKGQLSRVTADGELETARQVDVDKYTAWVKGKLLFDKTPLSEVAVQLERWYDIRCVLVDTSISTRHLTATFERESVQEVVEVIASAANLRVERSGSVVRFYDWKPEERELGEN